MTWKNIGLAVRVRAVAEGAEWHFCSVRGEMALAEGADLELKRVMKITSIKACL